MARDNRTSRRAAARTTSAAASSEAVSFSAANGLLALAGLLTLVLGYWLLSQGSVTAAPLLLVVAYVVLLPLAIIV